MTLGELINPAQFILIRQAARRLQIDPELECAEKMGCLTQDLSKSAADEFINHLWSLETPAHT